MSNDELSEKGSNFSCFFGEDVFNVLWEPHSAAAPQRKRDLGDLYPDLPCVNTSPKISPTRAFHRPFQAFLMAESVLCLDSPSLWVCDLLRSIFLCLQKVPFMVLLLSPYLQPL